MKKGMAVLTGLMLAVGLLILFYPTVSDLLNRRHGTYAIQELQEQMGELDSSEMEQKLSAARQYNRDIQSADEDPEDMLKDYERILDFGGGIMGYIRIPKINVKLPIYHGVESQVLEKGIGHMPMTAFPIGGSGNHTVLTGHTGLPSARLFTDLTKMETEDLFEVVIGGSTVLYEIDQIKIVLPEETEDLAAVPGMDYCTLVTCTPYGVNSHRLLVRGTHIEPQEVNLPTEAMGEEAKEIEVAPWWLIPVPAVILAAVMIRRKKRCSKG